MKTSSSVLLTQLFRTLPFRLSRRLQYWLMPVVSDAFAWAYERAELRFAPGIFLRVPRSRDGMYDQIALFGLYEERLSDICRQAGRRGGLMIDVGANVGYFTSIFLAQHHSNRAIALEPSPRMRSLLIENLRANGIAEQAIVHDLAASSEQETRVFIEPSDLTGWGKFGDRGFGNEQHTYQVKCLPLDVLIGPEAQIKFLKIDVEGAELLVLQGARRMLETRQIETLYVEINKPGAISIGLDPDAALLFLKAHKYALRRIGPDRSIEDWIAEPETPRATVRA